MPIFEYKCNKCGKVSELWIRSSSDAENPVKCPKCGDEMKRILSSCSARFYGAGFYKQSQP